MAIFSRRVIQHLIDENARFLLPRQTKEHIRRLNSADESSLDAEWEVVLLNALSKLGKVVHVPDFGSRPDIYFVSEAEPTQPFIADIATISDRGLEGRYPVRALWDRLMKIVRERGLMNNSFFLKIGGNYGSRFSPNHKSELGLPSNKKDFDKFVFNTEFYDWLERLATSQYAESSLYIKNEKTDLLLTYNPSQPFATLTHVSYTRLTSLVQNTVYNRLEEKVGKLVKANFNGPSGIILCDGGCSYLISKGDWASYRIDDVIHYFLRAQPLVSFVMTVRIEQHFGFGAHRETITKIYPGVTHDALGNDVKESLGKLAKAMPEAERSADNAVNMLRASCRSIGDSFIGGLTVGDSEIKISARAILDLLAGRITQEDFFKLHHFISEDGGGPQYPNPFDDKLSKGRLIVAIDVEESDRDDNWLVIKFGDTDPAVSPFRTPANYTQKPKKSQ